MRVSSYYFILISGFFGLLSILADQYSYQLEKSITLLEYSQDDQINRVEFGISANKLAASLQGLLEEQMFYSTIFDDISDEEKTRSFNELKISFTRQIDELAANELFLLVKPESFEANSEQYMHFITSEDGLYDDLINFYDSLWDDMAFILTKGSHLSSRSLTDVLILFEKIADLRFYRQISLIAAICSSFLSLFFVFVFFKKFIRERNIITNL